MISERDGSRAEIEGAGSSPQFLGTRSLLATVVLALLVVGCTDQEPSVVRPDEAAISLSEREAQAAQEAEAFAEVIDSLNDDNEILIALKDRDVPVVSPEFAGGDKAELASGEPGVAFPVVPESAPRREAEGFAPAGADARDKIRTLLSAHDIEIDDEANAFPVFRVTLPDGKVVQVLQDLLISPSVDFVEASRTIELKPTAGPVGDNNPDDKHIVHQVQKAWDFTRGEGAKIGILDSGFAGWSIGNWHPDGDYNSTQSYGIIKYGFNNYYGTCTPPNCEPRDDHGHGTRMAGLVGANDNDLQFSSVGIAPFSEVYSMKIAANCQNAGCGDGTFETDNWILVDAFDYACANDLDVLSMSWSTNGGSLALSFAISEAYNTHDVLLLASTGNGSDHDWLVEKSVVMGVGGMDSDSTSYGEEDHEEISALSGGTTTDADCAGGGFCDPDGTSNRPPTTGGTSASTAIAAAIAGLVRSYYPYWSAPTVRDRLEWTADLPYTLDLVNAYEAIVGNPPVPTITGPDMPNERAEETWYAYVVGGFEPFTYQWHRDGVPVGQGDSYTGNTGCEEFKLKLTVTDADDRTAWTTKTITPDGYEPGTLACPE